MKFTLAMLAAATAVSATPFMRRQAVTAKISPSAAAPSGCLPTYSGTFGIAVMNVTKAATGSSAAVATTKSDGQPGAASSAASTKAVTTLSDGQPQAATSTAKSVAAVSTLSDGQPQATTAKASSVAAISTISDGQPQAATKTSSMAVVSQISDGQIQAGTMTMAPINQITDGQIQNQMTPKTSSASKVSAVSQISDGQIQATTAKASSSSAKSVAAVSTLSDGQPQASTAKATASAVSTLSDGQPQASTGSKTSAVAAAASASSTSMSYVACKASDTLQITLAGGVLTDNQGRTGYIASNYQFQFDGPPQAGAIYTAGWSACANSSLALGGSAVFYQCLSGNFYNLYDRNWAPQCVPITIQTVNLVNC